MTSIATRVKELGLELPPATVPSANYVSTKECGGILYLSGQIAREGSAVPARFLGKVGASVSMEDAKDAARLCALNLVAQIAEAVNDELERVQGVVRVRGFVNAVPEFEAHPAIVDAASDLLVRIFGDRGRHVRTAIGAGSLPRNVAVEIDADVQL